MNYSTVKFVFFKKIHNQWFILSIINFTCLVLSVVIKVIKLLFIIDMITRIQKSRGQIKPEIYFHYNFFIINRKPTKD